VSDIMSGILQWAIIFVGGYYLVDYMTDKQLITVGLVLLIFIIYMLANFECRCDCKNR
jgi:hypothetical protein